MEDMFSRTRMLIGDEGLKRLRAAHVAVFGLGGVGGYAAEALLRAGIGRLTLVDGDVFTTGNLNRQIFALRSTLNKNKAVSAKARLEDINPEAEISAVPVFFNAGTAPDFDFQGFDYVVDAIDSVKDKALLIKSAQGAGAPVISAMGAGGRLGYDFKVGDIYATKGCPLARVMRLEVKKAGIKSLKTVYSEAPAVGNTGGDNAYNNDDNKKDAEGQEVKGKSPPPSISYPPGICGLIMAGEVVRDIIKSEGHR